MVHKGLEPEGAWQGAGDALQPEAASAAAEVKSRHRYQDPGPFGAWVLIHKGLEPEGAWQGAGGALQPEAASAAAEVKSPLAHHIRTSILIQLAS